VGGAPTGNLMKRRIVIAGGSGFIGTVLAGEFQALDFEVVVLTRTPRMRTDGVKEVLWNGEHIGEWIQALDGAEAVINLTGKSVNCPHTPENLKEAKASRVNSVNAIAGAFTYNKVPPRVWVQASATGYYGDTRDQSCNEVAPNGRDNLSKVCQEWEAAFWAHPLAKMRRVALRVGFVLGREGGALPILVRLTKNFLGGAAGNGRQYISWIHIADVAKMFVAAVVDEKLTGTYNAVAPEAVTNAEFMRELRRVLHRPWCPPAPEFMVRLGAKWTNSDPSLALTSQRCVPQRFQEAQFFYRFPQLNAALRDLCSKK
jgi:uncharacterized protein (TIGR01777 family)